MPPLRGIFFVYRETICDYTSKNIKKNKQIMSDFFDLPEDSFVKNSSSNGGKKTNPNEYDPDPNAFNGSYKSVFRFVPYVFDKTKSKFTKYSAKFWNPLSKEALFVDCPSNEGKPSILWTIERVLKQLKNDEPELHEKLSANFSRWYTHHSIVYIKKDPQRPELENTLKVFKFRNQIDQLIEQQINPEQVDDLTPIKKVNPYHLLQGKDFLCSVGKKTKTFRDWSKCKFMDEVTPLVFKIGDKMIKVENNEKSAKLVQEFLTKYSPKLDEYAHQAWTDETYEKVASFLIASIGNRHVINMILEQSKDEKINALVRAKLEGKATPKTVSSTPASSIDEGLEFKSESESEPFESLDSTEPDATVDTPSSAGGDEYDALFADL